MPDSKCILPSVQPGGIKYSVLATNLPAFQTTILYPELSLTLIPALPNISDRYCVFRVRDGRLWNDSVLNSLETDTLCLGIHQEPLEFNPTLIFPISVFILFANVVV